MIKYKYIFVVLVYRNFEDIEEFVENVKKLNLESKIIIINSYYDKKGEIEISKLANQHNCDFLSIENKGYGYGNNRGIEFTLKKFDFEYLVVSNADIIIEKFNEDSLNKMDNNVIGPMIQTLKGKNQNPYWYVENKFTEKLIYKGYKEFSVKKLYTGIIINKISREFNLLKFKLKKKREQKVFALHGSFIIFPYKVLKNIGCPYDEDMFLFAEEQYLAHYLKRNEIKSYITKDISITHKEDGSMGISKIDSKSEGRKSVITYYEKLYSKSST